MAIRVKVWHVEATGEPTAGPRDSGWRYGACEPAADCGRVLWVFERLLANGATVQVACEECGADFGTGTAHSVVAVKTEAHIARARQLELQAHVAAGRGACYKRKVEDHYETAAARAEDG